MKLLRLTLPLLLCSIALAFTVAKKDRWTQLYNGKDLSGWDTYIRINPEDQNKPTADQLTGLNKDPQHVFTVVKDGGENVIRVSGENWGAIISKSEYENYHLQLQFKWGALSWGPKKGQKKDSGLLYNSVGKYGADGGSWMRSQEFQIEEGNTGDYWGCAGGEADIPADKKSETSYVYNPAGAMTVFSQDSKQGRHCIKQGDAENPSGQWNTLDLYTHGDTSIHVVNGKVMMVLYHNRQMDNGQETLLTKGRIQLQSEGAELFYRHIQIQSIDHLPTELIKQ